MIEYISWERKEQIHPRIEHFPTWVKAATHTTLPGYGMILFVGILNVQGLLGPRRPQLSWKRYHRLCHVKVGASMRSSEPLGHLNM